MNALSTLPGFSNPVKEAQAVFRAALNALARPGILVSLPVLLPPLPGSGFSQGMLALALTLCDNNTPLWLDPAADTPEVRHHLRFHSASLFTTNPSEASLAFITEAETMPSLHDFNQGRADFPDRSATLIIRANLFESRRQALELTGPGVKGNDRGIWQGFHLSGLPSWFWEDWEANHASYPLGVDVIFVDTETDPSGASSARLLGLPRTARVREASLSLNSKEHTLCM